jgi:DNA end-binding protein Ku
MPRPFWSGHVQISLVSFAVNLFPLVEAKSEIHFHQLSRKTGERIHHQKVTADQGPVESEDIVKGYEYKKDKYLAIEPKEIEHLRVKSRKTIEITQFVGLDEIAPEFFEKPYLLVPGKEGESKAFAVVRKALAKTGKAALGKIAFGGREHLLAITAPADPKIAGMMAYTLHYAEELRDPADYSTSTKQPQVSNQELSLALELIQRQSAKFAPDQFTDEYEAALKELVQAKLHKQPIPQEEPAAKTGKVVNLMDALRKSVQGGARAAKAEPDRRKKNTLPHKGLALVKGKTKRSRKTA